MDGGQLDARLIGLDLVGDSLVQLGDEGGERVRVAVVGPSDDRVHVRPALGAGLTGGRVGRPPDPGEHVAHELAERPLLRGGRRGAQARDRGAHVVAGKEGLASGDGDGDASVSQSLLEGLGLAVGAHEDGDVVGLDAAGDEVRDLCGDARGLGVVVIVGAVAHVRSPVALAGQAHGALALGGSR